jgi:hypothetical protein
MKNLSLVSCLDRYRSEYREMHGPAMVELIDMCTDLLDRDDLYFSISHHFMWISAYAEYEEAREHPALLLVSDGQQFEFAYKEQWRDGELRRGREETIRCNGATARMALQEMLNRLVPVRP